MNNRINLKELSDLLLKEVEKGNGDAYVFVGEYYVSKENHPDGTNKEPFIIYTDKYNKEKVAALSYIHVQKLTDEENLELTKRLDLDKKSKKSSKEDSLYGSGYRPSSYRSYARYEDNNDYYGSNTFRNEPDQPINEQEQPVEMPPDNNEAEVAQDINMPVKKSRRVPTDTVTSGVTLNDLSNVFYTSSFIGGKKAKR